MEQKAAEQTEINMEPSVWANSDIAKLFFYFPGPMAPGLGPPTAVRPSGWRPSPGPWPWSTDRRPSIWLAPTRGPGPGAKF